MRAEYGAHEGSHPPNKRARIRRVRTQFRLELEVRFGSISLTIRDVPPMEEAIETQGRVTAVLAGTMFRVQLDNRHEVLAHISGRMRQRFIRLTVGDRVKLEMSPYDLNKARIIYRLG